VESFDQLEERAQRRLRLGPMLKAALLGGVLVFIVPAGPWMSHESMVNIMGRGIGTHAIAAIIGHFALALLQGSARCGYPLRRIAGRPASMR